MINKIHCRVKVIGTGEIMELDICQHHVLSIQVTKANPIVNMNNGITRFEVLDKSYEEIAKAVFPVAPAMKHLTEAQLQVIIVDAYQAGHNNAVQIAKDWLSKPYSKKRETESDERITNTCVDYVESVLAKL